MITIILFVLSLPFRALRAAALLLYVPPNRVVRWLTPRPAAAPEAEPAPAPAAVPTLTPAEARALAALDAPALLARLETGDLQLDAPALLAAMEGCRAWQSHTSGWTLPRLHGDQPHTPKERLAN